jgi:lipopolysaccharide biosynthesis glycosyltransferase
MDTIVIGSLEELFKTDLTNKPVACVYDNYVKKQPLIDLNEEGHYFNSGVMLINVPLWNKLRISERTLQYITDFPEKIRFVDQCGLNAVLKNNWHQLPNKFNLLYSYIPADISKRRFEEFIDDKIIIHYTLQRPWNYLCKNRGRHLYYKYLRLAGKTKLYSDFSFKKVPAKCIILLKEFYLDFAFLNVSWRFLKGIFIFRCTSSYR